jgi:alginate O-acetyltransferase complex protein AlgI
MLFNSFEFLFFFAFVTSAYFALPHRWRWLLLLVASCAFYMRFVPVYILILLATIVVDYFAGIWIEDATDPSRKRHFVVLSAVSVCVILFVFKYFNFVNENLAGLARALDWNYPIAALQLVLPIGLSFHTFQSLSYVLEVSRGKQKAERHFGIYSLYVMYFPQLVAGPIERPQNLLHQFKEEKHFDLTRLRDGFALLLWGLFKKVVVADSLAIYVDAVYNSSARHSGPSLLLATYFFAVQIYCDFSGYSDMARGISRVYGIELMKNFETPYFSRSIAEFWSRWHISLSTWFRDYVYVPLGGNRVSASRIAFNVAAVFVLSGFWHGAKWTFVVWGALNGAYLIVARFRSTSREGGQRVGGGVRRVIDVLVTFHLVLLSWVFFRAESLRAAIAILRKIFTDRGSLFLDPILVQCGLAIVLLFVLDFFNRKTGLLENLGKHSLRVRLSLATLLIFAIVLFGVDRGTQFIYFQF